MLYPNNTYNPCRIISGALGGVNNAGKSRSWTVYNGFFGSSVSRPQGRNSITDALTPPIKDGGNIAVRMIAETAMTTDLKAFGQMAVSYDVEATMSVNANILGNIYVSFQPEATMTVDLKAIGNMAVSFDILARPSAFDIAQEVWNASAAGYNNAGTMGEKVNSAGSAANPWTEVIEGTLTAAQMMRINFAVLAGKSDITGSTVTFRDVADTKNRITVSMTGSERASVTLDGS